jgi:hypothetical protein
MTAVAMAACFTVGRYTPDHRDIDLGFLVARTLTP